MHRVLGIPYLLKEIFTWMTRHEMTVVARVNHEWFASSIPTLWKAVRLKDALSLLGAIKSVPEKRSYRFKKVPDTKKWNRFEIYSPRVLSLEGRQEDWLALEVAMGSRPPNNDPLFPQCRFVSWEASSDQGLVDLSVFITANLDHFFLQVHDLEYSFFYRICERLKALSPTLKFLHLDILDPSDRTVACSDLAQNLLASFACHLRLVQIPKVFQIASILQKLYEIPKLGHLLLNTPGLVLCDPDTLTTTCGGHDGGEGFTSLENLSFGGPQESLCDRLLNLSSFSGLKKLYWYLNEELTDVQAFIDTIVGGCPQLQILDIGDSMMYVKRVSPRPVVPWSSIRPLLGCLKLRTLILHCFQVAMDSEDLMELLTNRKTWTVLEIFTAEPLCMNTLSLFATYCPNLESLGLFVDGFDLHLTPTDPCTFSCLRSIDFAFSQFPQEMVQSVASFFFEFCKEPPFLMGWDCRFWNAVSLAMAEKYIAHERINDVPMSPYTQNFVAYAVHKSAFSDDADIEQFGVDSDAEDMVVDDEDDMVVDDAL